MRPTIRIIKGDLWKEISISEWVSRIHQGVPFRVEYPSMRYFLKINQKGEFI